MKYTKGGEMPKELGSPIIFLFGASLSISLISIWTFQNKKKITMMLFSFQTETQPINVLLDLGSVQLRTTKTKKIKMVTQRARENSQSKMFIVI